jgi:hypothetical protein
MCYVAVIIYKIQIDCYQFSLVWFGFMMFNATFNNISVISWRSGLLVEATEVP